MEAPSEMRLSYQPQAAQAVTSLPAQSSNLFQNAAGFHIIGGQFVSGDVHNHQNTSPANTGVSSSPLNVMDENFSESEIYCNQLLRRKRGFPLYVPAPSQNLPAAYRRKGVAIGDVGRVTPEGIFDFFFNIYLPGDHSINDNDVPETFVPLLPYGSKDIVNMTYDPGDCVTTSSVQNLALDPPLDEFPGGDFVFSCGVPQGAILALPHGGHLEKLENVEAVRAYVATHAERWYKYITEVRGRALANGALYLVTGCEKAQSWGMSSFYSVDDQFQLAFKPRIRPDSTSQYRWSGVHGHRLPPQHKSYNSPPNGGPLNQTTFIHGLSISLGVGLWAKLFAKVEIRDIGEAHLGGVNGNSMPYSAGSSLFSWSLGILGGGAPTGGKQHAEQRGNVFLSDLSPISKIFHPGEIINAYILHKTPQATVVVSHDDDWSDILSDSDAGVIVQTVSELVQQISEQFEVVEKNGATFLQSTTAPQTNQPASTLANPVVPANPVIHLPPPPSPSHNGSYHISPYSNHSELSFTGEPESFGLFEDEPAGGTIVLDYDPSEYDATHSSLLMFNDNGEYLPGAYDHSQISSVPVAQGPHPRTAPYDYSSPSSAGPNVSPAPDYTSPAPWYSPAPGYSELPEDGNPNGGGPPNTDPGGPIQVSKQNATTIRTSKASHNRRTQEATFVCPVPGCGSTFTRSFNLKGHIRSHNEEKPFLCKWPGCGKGFARQHDCMRHEQLHTNYRPFNCDGCGKMFARMDALNRHLRSEGGAECQHTLEANGRMPDFTSGVMPGDNNLLGIGEGGEGGRARSYSSESYGESPEPRMMAKTEDPWTNMNGVTL